MTDPPDSFELPTEWTFAIPTDDESITRRRRALAPIQLLTDLERTKSSLDGDFWDEYDLFRIALAVIDQVALAMGLSAGKTWDETLAYAAEQAERQCPDRAPGEWETVAARVVVALVTTDVEIVRHLVHTAAGPAWRDQRFRLLYLHPSGTETLEHLRASEQAINIFVEALDLDIEAAQIANEAQLNALIARGAVESAVQIARHARYRSIQYQERIRRIIADTLIDPDTHDWLGDVPALLDDALRHVKDRLQAETALLDTVADRRATTTTRPRLEAMNQLIEILRECRRRHSALHKHLIGARGALRAAIDDRLSRPPRSRHHIDIGADLLKPLMSGSTAAAATAATRMVATIGGIPARWWPSLTTITDELCSAPRVPDPGVEYEPPEPDFLDTPEWWEPYEEIADSLLNAVDEPIRLSRLLARAERVAADLDDVDGRDPLDPRLLAAAIVHGAHHFWAPQLAGHAAGDRLVLAVSSGTELVHDGVRSDDLLLVPADLIKDIATAAPSEFRPARLDEQDPPE